MSFLGVATGLVGGIGNSVDYLMYPQDRQRDQQTDALKAAAIAGDDTSFLRLRCLAGDDSVHTQLVARGILSPTDPTCGYATSHARQYAQAAVAEVQARRVVATGAAGITGAGYTIGTAASASTYAQALGLPSSVPNWLIVLAVAGGAYLILRRR